MPKKGSEKVGCGEGYEGCSIIGAPEPRLVALALALAETRRERREALVVEGREKKVLYRESIVWVGPST